jgi:hypothetical protein
MNEIEEKYLPVIEILEDESFLKTIENEYKGFITASNPLISNPKILFIGINPGDGAYKEINQIEGQNQKYPKRLFSNYEIAENDWLKDGNARADSKPWKAYKWHDRNKKINNVFPKRLVEFFFAYYNIKKETDYDEIENKINSDIFYYNLYPIATTTTKQLNVILKKIVSRQIKLNEKEIGDIKDLKNYFRQRTIDVIENVQPEIIICLGKQSFKDLTFTNPNIDAKDATKRYDIKFRKNDEKKYPVYVVSRNGNWEERIINLGKHLNAL